MSGWQDYIKTLLASADCIKKGAIIGMDGSVWAKSDGTVGEDLQITPEECKAMVSLFQNLASAPEHGCHIEGAKYVIPKTEDNFLLGKKGKDGVMAAKTTQAILIAVYSGEGLEGVKCRDAVEHLSNYLVTSGY